MIITKDKKYTLITPKNETISEFHLKLTSSLSNLIGQHLIINFSSFDAVSPTDVKMFIEISNQKKSQNTSFVIIITEIDIDQVSEEIQIAPTLEEAIDILEMDAIARDLGF